MPAEVRRGQGQERTGKDQGHVVAHGHPAATVQGRPPPAGRRPVQGSAQLPQHKRPVTSPVKTTSTTTTTTTTTTNGRKVTPPSAKGGKQQPPPRPSSPRHETNGEQKRGKEGTPSPQSATAPGTPPGTQADETADGNPASDPDRLSLSDNEAAIMATREEERVYMVSEESGEKARERRSQRGGGRAGSADWDSNQDGRLFRGGERGDVTQGRDVNGHATDGDWNENALGQQSALDIRLFNSNLDDCVERLTDPRFQELRGDYPVEELVSLVARAAEHVREYGQHTQHTQQQLDTLRAAMKAVRDNLRLSVTRRVQDLTAAEAGEKTEEELELQARLARVNQAVAQACQDMADAARLVAETQEFSIKANLAAEEARKETQRIQEEIVRKEEAERLKAEEEERKREDEQKRKEEAARQAEAEKLAKEEERKKKEEQKTGYRSQAERNTLETWPFYIYTTAGVHLLDPSKESSSGGAEVLCAVRGNPQSFRPADLTCRCLEPSEVRLAYGDQDELISRILLLESTKPPDQPNPAEPIFVAMAYSIRLPTSREATVLAQKDQGWQTLVTNDVQIDGFKEYKFAQARLEAFTTLAIMSRFKRECLAIQPSKKPTKLASSYDQRVTITIPKGVFKQQEDLILQVQPVDSATVGEFRALGEARNKNLLTSSPVLHTEWKTQKFNAPITITLPCPPNPAKAKKMAALKKQKEEKMKTPAKTAPPPEEKAKPAAPVKGKLAVEAASVEDAAASAPQRATTRWYMGQYGQTDDDENDKLCLIGFSGGKFVYVPDVEVVASKIDMVTFDMEQAFERCLVLRVRTETEDEHLKLIAQDLVQQLSHRSIKVLVKQKQDDPYEVCVQVVPTAMVDRAERAMTEELYTIGSEKVPGANIREGETVAIQLRGNLKFKDLDTTEASTKNIIFNSNLPNRLTFRVGEVDRYLQKTFDSFRGAVRVTRQYYIMPTKPARPGEAPLAPTLKSQIICDVDVDIPKSHIEPDPIPTRVPIVLHSCGSVNEDMLRNVAEELGDEWTRLATALDIDSVRLQSIMRQVSARDMDDERVRFEMLMTWLKRCPQAADKVGILATALEGVNRHDLAQWIKSGRHFTTYSSENRRRSTLKRKSIASTQGNF